MKGAESGQNTGSLPSLVSAISIGLSLRQRCVQEAFLTIAGPRAVRSQFFFIPLVPRSQCGCKSKEEEMKTETEV